MLLNGPVWGTLTFAVLVIWLGALSFWLYKVARHYSRLVNKTGKEDLGAILEGLLTNQNEVDRHIKKVEDELGRLGTKAITQVGVMRFSPFRDTGGDQSFTLALLNEKNSGVVLLSLHGREGTRVYVKPIEMGKSRYELSREEKQAIEEASK